MERIPLKLTIFSDTLQVLLMFSVLLGALTVKWAWFIATVATLPIIALIMYLIWLKYGEKCFRVNQFYAFIMVLMMSIYCCIPLFSIIWNTWVGVVTSLLHALLFVIFYRYREPFRRMSQNRDVNGKKKDYPFMTWWFAGLGIIGISSFVFIFATVSFPPHEPEIIFTTVFGYSISFMFLTASPMSLIHPEQLIKWKLLHRKEYK